MTFWEVHEYSGYKQVSFPSMEEKQERIILIIWLVIKGEVCKPPSPTVTFAFLAEYY